MIGYFERRRGLCGERKDGDMFFYFEKSDLDFLDSDGVCYSNLFDNKEGCCGPLMVCISEGLFDFFEIDLTRIFSSVVVTSLKINPIYYYMFKSTGFLLDSYLDFSVYMVDVSRAKEIGLERKLLVNYNHLILEDPYISDFFHSTSQRGF